MVEASVFQISKYATNTNQLIQYISKISGKYEYVVKFVEEQTDHSKQQTSILCSERIMNRSDRINVDTVNYTTNHVQVLNTILGVEVSHLTYKPTDTLQTISGVHQYNQRRYVILIVQWFAQELQYTLSFRRTISPDTPASEIRTKYIDHYLTLCESQKWIDLYRHSTNTQLSIVVPRPPKSEQIYSQNPKVLSAISLLTNKSVDQICILITIQALLNISIHVGFIETLYTQTRGVYIKFANTMFFSSYSYQYNIEGDRVVVVLQGDRVALLSHTGMQHIQLTKDLGQTHIATGVIQGNALALYRVLYAEGVTYTVSIEQLVLAQELAQMIQLYKETDEFKICGPIVNNANFVDLSPVIQRTINEDGLQYNGIIIIEGNKDYIIRRVNIFKILLAKVSKDEIPYGNDRRFVNMTPYELRVCSDEIANTGREVDKINTTLFKTIIPNISQYYWRQTSEDQQESYDNKVVYMRYDPDGEPLLEWVVQSIAPYANEELSLSLIDSVREAEFKLLRTIMHFDLFIKLQYDYEAYYINQDVLMVLNAIISKKIQQAQSTINGYILGYVVKLADLNVYFNKYNQYTILHQDAFSLYKCIENYLLQSKRYKDTNNQIQMHSLDSLPEGQSADYLLISSNSEPIISHDVVINTVQTLMPRFILYIQANREKHPQPLGQSYKHIYKYDVEDSSIYLLERQYT